MKNETVWDVVRAASKAANETGQRGAVMTRGAVPALETAQAVNRARDPFGTRTGGAISVGDYIRAGSVEAFAAADASKAAPTKASREAARASVASPASPQVHVEKAAHVLVDGICVSCSAKV